MLSATAAISQGCSMTRPPESSSRSLPRLAAWLACRDWLHEFSLSLCSVLALASIMAPLLVLHGVHMGVVQRLRENLMKDPGVLVIIPSGGKGAGFEAAFIEKMARLPGLAYAIGRTRDVASELQVTSPEGRRQTIALEATSPGDPLFANFAVPQPVSSPGDLKISLSAQAARKLGVAAGEKLESALARRSSTGKFERMPLELTVVSVLPAAASNLDAGFVDMATLQAVQDFRDGISSPLLGYIGEIEPPQARHYESFRAYAAGIDEVEGLEQWFLGQDVPVKTRSRDIANIRKIDSTLGAVISLIACAGVAGFLAFMGSTSLAAVRRKWKEIGMLRLTGFSRFSLWVFPLVQVLLTGICGCLLAFVLYAGVAYAIDAFFSAETGGDAICSISWQACIVIFAGVQILALLAGGWAAKKAASISPVEVIREA